MKASTDWIAANPDAAAAHVAGTLSLEVEDVQEMMRFNVYELTIDDEMLEDMASTAQFLLEAGKILSLIHILAPTCCAQSLTDALWANPDTACRHRRRS